MPDGHYNCCGVGRWAIIYKCECFEVLESEQALTDSVLWHFGSAGKFAFFSDKMFFKPVILIRQMTCFRLEQCLIDLFFILPSHIDDKMYFFSVFLLDFFHCCFCPYQSLSFLSLFQNQQKCPALQ